MSRSSSNRSQEFSSSQGSPWAGSLNTRVFFRPAALRALSGKVRLPAVASSKTILD
ncbi:hypothetical protein D3C85_1877550 [compost metagenome]